ncbi:putative HVA22-like protein g [Rhodamnia argentea]|uniref:HVA22-like protein n=1 Tax=Rhodamnia argentea TaxID=178133 RepID=A0A8B8Q315_9MYRT|nr:putative HVA22-like protein g [Rhodamnia argentea]
MIGSFLTRGLVLVFGYAYPAYECYKTVEKNRPEIEQLRFWCQYWILVAVLTVCERIGDTFVSWVPMYSEAKLAFFIYLWYPKTMGTTYVYDSFFRPYVAKHENDIDRNLLELRTRAGDFAVMYWQRAASYGQTRVFDILQYIASQSTPVPRPAQPPQQGNRGRPARSAANCKPTPKVQVENEEPPSPTSSTSSMQEQKDVAEVAGPLNVPKAAPSPSAPPAPKTASVSEDATQPATGEAAAKQIEAQPSTSTENGNPPPKETVMEETLRRTGTRLRKTRSAPGRKETDSETS